MTSDVFNNPPFCLLYPLSTSFGAACIGDGQTTAEGVYHRANNAVYEIGVLIVQEWWPKNDRAITSDINRIGVAEYESLIQNLLDRNPLGVDGLRAQYQGATYSQGGLGEDQMIALVECVLRYEDLDLLG